MVIRQEREVMKYDKRHKLNTVTLCANFTLGLIWFSLLLITLTVDPIMLVFKQYTRVTNGSFVHEMMLKEIEGLHLRAYLFNVTNAEEFLSGNDTQLRVNEVGPFTYREMRSNLDVVIDEQAERLWYTPHVRLEFLPEESVASPEDLNVTAPNIPMLGMLSKMTDSLYFSQVAFNLLTSQLQSKPLVSVDASSYLWGYEEPLVSLSHKIIPGSVSFEKMGILDRIYDSDQKHRIEVSIADEDKYMIQSHNGHKRLAMSLDIDPDMCSLCNTFDDAYEGVGYRPDIDSSFPINLYRIGICRMFHMEYHGTKPMDYGADAMVYHFKDDFFTLDPEMYSNGVLALPDCFMGVPLALSKAHFVGVDPSMYERIEGIDPNPERFQSWIAVDPKVGLQLETKISLQLNLVIGDISYNQPAKSFANMVLPICFIEIEQSPLPDESKLFLNGVYHTGPWILIAAQICFLILLLISWGYFIRALYQYFTLKDDTVMSFPVVPEIKEINANNIEEPLMKDTQRQR